MYDLLSDIKGVPVEPESLVRVHTGMNKVRISVGENISEPSEVYIATGKGENGYETYIVFFMIEPALHVLYGFDQNPYDPSVEEVAINEAIDFVEEMGSILEEVPWENMTPEQRTAWIDKESMYHAAGASAPEVLEVVEEIEPAELLEVVEEDETEEVLEVIDEAEMDLEYDDEDLTEELIVEEVQELEDDEPAGDIGDDEDEDDEEGEDLPGETVSPTEDVLVVDGDFDDLLKQAFLKPDVARKTRKRKKQEEIVEETDDDTVDEVDEKTETDSFQEPVIEMEEGLDDETVADSWEAEQEEVSVGDDGGRDDEDEADPEGFREEVDPEPGKSSPESEVPIVATVTPVTPVSATTSAPSADRSGGGSDATITADEKTLLDVVRFLSRF